MIDQSIFEGLGSNWKWASLNISGIARVHSDAPVLINTDKSLSYSTHRAALRPPHNQPVSPEGMRCVVVERTNFENGPDCWTDQYGDAFPTPVLPIHQPPMAAPAAFPEAGNPFSKELLDAIDYEFKRAEPIERTHLGDGTPMADAHPAFDSEPDANDEDDGDSHGWADELEEAKERAAYLLQNQYNNGNEMLSVIQYVAIFGELPK